MTLTEFLLARIAEDEAAAQNARNHSQMAHDYERDNYGFLWVKTTRVLAECETKRLIVGQHPTSTEWDEGINSCMTCQWDIDCDAPKHDHQRGFGRFPCPTLRILALPYADHPDHQEDWRP